jgi:hypothetical protein
MTTIASVRLFRAGLVGVMLTAAAAGPPIAAQSSLLPHATLRVVPQTHGQVWPGDFNRDGITDLASGADDITEPTTGGEFVQIALGNGDGTFRAPIVSATPGMVRGVADLNRDGRADVVAMGHDGLIVLPGNGNGTLQAPRGVTSEVAFAAFVLVVDLNADGRRDLTVPRFIGTTQYLAIYPGRGDFTFDDPVLLPLDRFPLQATTGDFDGDGRLDLAVTHLSVPPAPGQLTIYLNSGLFQFAGSAVAVPKSATDVTPRDLNGDGDLDLVVSGSTHPGFSYANDGFVYVFTGGGDGTFTLSGTYPTAIGPVAIVVGDFTRDGRLDVATANLSYRIYDGCLFIKYSADSVSILPGNGNGTFGATTTFALGSQVYGVEPFGAEVDSLNTSDLNRDGHPDLIASDGRLLIAAAPRSNRAPVVNAGEDVTETGANTIVLHAGGSDPDGHLLSFRVTDTTGRIDQTDYVGCIDNVPAERHELTVTASDGRLQSSDTVVFDFAFRDPGPEGWTNGDIGGVAAAGRAVFNPQQNEFTVRGSGADIWSRADEFHFTQTPVTGDFTIYTRVASVEPVHRWTKAGLMIREGLAPGARHASLFVTPTPENGIAFQRRLATNGLSVHTAGPALTATVIIMLKRNGDLVSAYYRLEFDGTPWIVIGRDSIPGLAATVNVGLAVTSHVDGTLATARFRDLILFGPSDVMVAGDIGAVGVPGTGNFGPTTGEMQGSGADIWGTGDAFYFFRQWWTSDATATMRVQSLEHTHRWAKLGLMFRETPDPGSRHVMLVVSAGAGLAMQYRAQPNGVSANVALTAGAAPEWLRLRRTGNTFTGDASEDGVTWRTVGSITLPLDIDTYVGVALTSHNNSTLATGVFDSLSVVREP